MATRVCPQCGTQYVASVRRCIDCDAMLVDDVGPEGDVTATVSTPLGAGDQIAYELDGWGNQLRVTLAGMLDLQGIAYVWEAGALVVAAPHEASVDEMIAAVEGGEGEELAADVPQVAFEIEGVSADELAALDAELIAAHIPHAWQETGELLVPETDEDQVAELIDAVLNPDEDESEEDGLATHAALDALYVAVDKLVKDPADDKLVARFVAAGDGLGELRVPYGMSGNEWDALLAQVAELGQLLDQPTELVRPGSADRDADEVDEIDDGDDGDDGDEIDDADASDPIEDADVAEDADGADDSEAVDEAGDPPVGEDRLALARGLAGQLRTRLLDLV